MQLQWTLCDGTWSTLYQIPGRCPHWIIWRTQCFLGWVTLISIIERSSLAHEVKADQYFWNFSLRFKCVNWAAISSRRRLFVFPSWKRDRRATQAAGEQLSRYNFVKGDRGYKEQCCQPSDFHADFSRSKESGGFVQSCRWGEVEQFAKLAL